MKIFIIKAIIKSNKIKFNSNNKLKTKSQKQLKNYKLRKKNKKKNLILIKN